MDDAVFDVSAWRSAHLLKLITERGAYGGYLPKPSESCFIANVSEQEEGANRRFATEVLDLNFVGSSRYLGDYLGTKEELEAWMKPKV